MSPNTKYQTFRPIHSQSANHNVPKTEAVCKADNATPNHQALSNRIWALFPTAHKGGSPISIQSFYLIFTSNCQPCMKHSIPCNMPGPLDRTTRGINPARRFLGNKLWLFVLHLVPSLSCSLDYFVSLFNHNIVVQFCNITKMLCWRQHITCFVEVSNGACRTVHTIKARKAFWDILFT